MKITNFDKIKKVSHPYIDVADANVYGMAPDYHLYSLDVVYMKAKYVVDIESMWLGGSREVLKIMNNKNKKVSEYYIEKPNVELRSPDSLLELIHSLLLQARLLP